MECTRVYSEQIGEYGTVVFATMSFFEHDDLTGRDVQRRKVLRTEVMHAYVKEYVGKKQHPATLMFKVLMDTGGTLNTSPDKLLLVEDTAKELNSIW